jgi:hypothetical protein
MNAGHPGPHYTSSFSGGTGGGWGTIPDQSAEIARLQAQVTALHGEVAKFQAMSEADIAERRAAEAEVVVWKEAAADYQDMAAKWHAAEIELERYAHGIEVATDDVNKAEARVEVLEGVLRELGHGGRCVACFGPRPCRGSHKPRKDWCFTCIATETLEGK